MNREELILKLAQKMHISHRLAGKLVKAFFFEWSKALIQGERIELRGFGSLKVKERKAHWNIDPRSKKKVLVSRTKIVHFKPSKKILSLLNPCPFQEIKPLIIPRSQHPISRKNISREALRVLYRLKDHGYISYLVGGSVRDLLLGITPKDFDVGTNAKPQEIRKLFRWSRIIGRRFRLVHVFFKGGKFIEVVTFRGPENLEKNGEEIYGAPWEDAFRRDLTINALFYNIADFSVIDYVGGMKDLREGIIRIIGDPELRFLQDPVRMMRAIRHAARIGFTIEPRTWESILKNKDKIHLCPSIRIRDEWLKDILGGWAKPWVELMFKSGLFGEIFPLYEKIFLKKGSSWKNFFFKSLGYLDSQIKKQKFSPSQALALFFYPFLIGRGRLSLCPKRPSRPYPIVKKELAKIFFPYDFKKELFENTAQLLTGLWPVKYHFLFSSRFPKRLVRKSYFQEALELVKIIVPLEREFLGLKVSASRRKKRYASLPKVSRI